MMILFLHKLVESPKIGTEGMGEVRFFKTLISVFGFEWNYTEGARVLRGWRVGHEGRGAGRARGSCEYINSPSYRLKSREPVWPSGKALGW